MTKLLELDHVTKLYPVGGLLSRQTIKAVNDVSFSLDTDRPEIFAIVGESGSGTSTMAKMILGDEIPNGGRLVFDGNDIGTIRNRGQREAFMARVQPVFQNPFEAFNPLTRVDAYLFGTAHRFTGASTSEEKERVCDQALQRVGLSMAEIKGRFSHELSGGQLQRVAVARALIPSPKLIVADEPVSMVDASLRSAILDVLVNLRQESGISFLYVTHDLSTAYHIADELLVLYDGETVERGAARAVIDHPQHDYTRRLIDAVPVPDPDVRWTGAVQEEAA